MEGGGSAQRRKREVGGRKYSNRKVKHMRDKDSETETEHKWRTYRCNGGTD